MKISLNPSEARTLVKMLYLAEQVLTNSGDQVPEAFLRRCETVMNRLLPAARDGGCPDLIEEDDDGNLLLSPDIEREPGVIDAILDHESSVFWEQLVSRLAERDYELHKGRPVIREEVQEFEDMSQEEWDELQEDIDGFESSYWNEFERHGVKHLHVMRGAGHPS